VTLKKYKVRLNQLNNGYKEIYKGEKQIIIEIIKKFEQIQAK